MAVPTRGEMEAITLRWLRYRSVYDFTGLLVQVGNLKAKPAV